jgi:putative SOS response-associated peptidase YedK
VRGIPYAFAGLWEAWKDKATGETKETFTIITTEPNEVMKGLHDRMPVILYQRDYARWMALADPAKLPVNLLRPYPAEDLKAI